MRFIDVEKLDQTRPKVKEILAALDEAQKEVNSEGDPNERKKLIDKYQSRWSALRPYLEELSHNKCWYLECLNPGTDDDLDHFRPKSGVSEAPEHPGYYWRAFDWYNYRLSCHRANRPRVNPETRETGGKAGHFPLLDELTRAYSPYDDIDDEMPGLLDPTDPADPRFISFNINGEAVLSPRYKGRAVPELRFEYSRQYLHLNWPRFTDDRIQLYSQIMRYVERGKRAAPRSFDRRPSDAFKDVIRDIRRLMAPEAPYSSAAVAYVESFRHEWWVDQIVLGGSR